MKKGLRYYLLLLMTILLGLTGCGRNGGNAENTGAKGTEEGEEQEGAGQMGRYMETEYDLSEMLSRPGEIVKKEDGSYVIFDYNNGFLVSTDGGKTWEKDQKDWFDELNESSYIMNLKVSPKGGAVYAADPYPEEESEEEMIVTLHPVFYYVDEEGNKLELNIPYNAENYDYVNQFYFSPEGKLYGAALGGKLFEINLEDGSSREIYESNHTIKDIVFIGKSLMLFDEEDIVSFDPETGKTEQADEALKDFILNETSSNKYNYSDAKGLVTIQGEEENTVYMAFNKGLYRHIIGGSVTEQMVNGSLSTLGDPSAMLIDMELLPEGRFMILFSNGKLIHYTYDETVSSVPANTLTAYSLRDNDVLRQAIINYQKKNPDVYVKYEIGMDNSSGVTKEDALKKLNTEIMAGKGPDVFLMDGLPVDSYVQKGILADISPYLTDLEQEGALLQNVVDVYKKDDRIYMLPAQIKIMIMAGKQENISKIQDLKTLADEVEALREQYPEGSLFDFYTESVVLRALMENDMPAIISEDGSVDEVRLTEFLTQAKRIYQAEIAGIPQERLDEYRKNMSEIPVDELKYMIIASNNCFSMATGQCRIGIGTIGDFDWDLSSVVSLKNLNQNYGYAAYEGMIGNVFKPDTMVAVNAKSDQQEIAGELVQMLFSEETLSLPVTEGFAVNKKALQEKIDSRNGKDGEVFGGMASSDDEGNYFEYDMRGATQEEIDEVYHMLENAKIPNFGYDVIEDAIYELGADALNGSKSIEDTVGEIIKKVAIYLAE